MDFIFILSFTDYFQKLGDITFKKVFFIKNKKNKFFLTFNQIYIRQWNSDWDHTANTGRVATNEMKTSEA